MMLQIFRLHVSENPDFTCTRKKRLSDFLLICYACFLFWWWGRGRSFLFFITTAKDMNAKAYRPIDFDFYGLMLEK